MSMEFKGHWTDVVRCPTCRSRKVRLAPYKDGSWYLECEGCMSVIHEIPKKDTALARALVKNGTIKEAT